MTITLDPDNTLIEPELYLYARKGVIQDIHIREAAEGYMLKVQLTWRPEDLYLATRRDRTQPKYFKSIRPLLDILRTHVPGISSVMLELVPAESPAPPPPRRRRRSKLRAGPGHTEKD